MFACTWDPTVLLRQTMQCLEQKLDPTHFVRIHRTMIVNLKRVRDTRAASDSDHVIVMHQGTQLQMSRACRERLAPFREPV